MDLQKKEELVLRNLKSITCNIRRLHVPSQFINHDMVTDDIMQRALLPDRFIVLITVKKICDTHLCDVMMKYNRLLENGCHVTKKSPKYFLKNIFHLTADY